MNAVHRQLPAEAPGATAPALEAKSGPSPLPAPDPLQLLLSRTSFGIESAQWAAATAAGYDAWLEAQLAPETIDDGGLEALLRSSLPTLSMSNGQILELRRNPATQNQAANELSAATVVRQAFSPRQLYEVMVQFWSNHFAMFIGDGLVRYLKTVDDREVIRRHALGRFGDLLKATARSPAMLYSLDNYLNVASGPQENYARELLELHTLGADGGYTEDDVKAVARAFTGWTFTGYDGTTGTGEVQFAFVRGRHDIGAKRVLGVDLPPGRGIEDGEQVLDLLLEHPSTGRFLARKLVRHFVDDDPPAALVEAVAASYRATRGDIRAMLRTLLRSAEFKASHDRKVKRGGEYVVAALRAAGATVSGDWLRAIGNQLATLGQAPFQWETPDGYPDVAPYWVNTSAMLGRWNFALALLEQRVAGVGVNVAALLGKAATPAQVVDNLAQRLLRRPLAPSDRAAFVAFVAAGAAPDAPIASSQRTARARDCAALMLASPYFMYR